jgi:hypothetical protein
VLYKAPYLWGIAREEELRAGNGCDGSERTVVIRGQSLSIGTELNEDILTDA